LNKKYAYVGYNGLLAISKIKLPEKFKLLKNFRSFKIALVTEET